MHPSQQAAVEAFTRVYGTPPQCVAFAPGRIEVIGNHTDYNGGYVLSVAMDIGVAVAAARIPGFAKTVEIHSEEFKERLEFPLETIAPEKGSWANYPRGVLKELDAAGVTLKGTRMAIASSLPIGAGVSSSAALELATAQAMYELYGGRPGSPMEEAKLCQRAEVGFVGVPCGLLDQFSSRFGKRNHALFLDCLTLRHQQIPLGREDVRVVLVDSGAKHALVDGKYADLRRSCERATVRFRELIGPEVRFLRDVTIQQFAEHAEALEEEDRSRAEHVIRENERVIRGVAAIKSRSYDELRRLMLASHASSRDLFRNSTPELDFLVNAASDLDGFLGAKLSGGGFGGSTVNLVEERHLARFAETIADRFEKQFGRRPRQIITPIGDGARVESLHV